MSQKSRSQIDRVLETAEEFRSSFASLSPKWWSLYGEVFPLNQASGSGFDVEDELARIRSQDSAVEEVRLGLNALRNTCANGLETVESIVIEQGWIPAFVAVLDNWKQNLVSLISSIDMALEGLDINNPLDDGYPHRLNLFVTGTNFAFPLARELYLNEFDSNVGIRSKLRKRFIWTSLSLLIASVVWSALLYASMPTAVLVVTNLGFLVLTVVFGYRLKRSLTDLGFHGVISYGISLTIWFLFVLVVRSFLGPAIEDAGGGSSYF